jgi:thiosulfate/3-mercaptopyruvate sulfurtransferase
MSGASTPPDNSVRAARSVHSARDSVLVTAGRLQGELSAPTPPLLLDVRWALGDPNGYDHYLDGHLPEAVFVDLERELASASSTVGGRHPLPDVKKLTDDARGWGLTQDRAVVVYDNSGGLAASRAWWLLRWAGVSDVRILDGTLAAWTAAGYELQTGEVERSPGDVTLTGGHLPVIDPDETATLSTAGVLLDARAGERYRGEVEPIDPQAGHIPGARSAPTAENLSADGHFLATEDLVARFAGLGITPDTEVGAYCGSGVTAAHQIAALTVAGIDAALFPGSWSAWSADPARPIARGADA